jgi:hypothetical protein
MSYKRLMEVHMIAKKQISGALRREIEVRAYLIWEDEGRPHGCEREHWARAEAEILGTAKAVAPTKKTTPAKSNAKTTSDGAAKAAIAAKAVATKTKKAAKPKSPKSR